MLKLANYIPEVYKQFCDLIDCVCEDVDASAWL